MDSQALQRHKNIRDVVMQNLNKIIEIGESETLEFKASFGEGVIETATAFANTHGGKILLGIANDGSIVGTSFGDEALRDYVNRIANATEPSIYPDAYKVSDPTGDVIVLSIPEFPLKPVSMRGRSFRRSGTNTRRMSTSEISSMHMQSCGLSMDTLSVVNKTVDDLDLSAVIRYMRTATAKKRRSFTEDGDPVQVLKKLNLITSNDEISRAAILLFGKEPQTPMSQARIHAGRLREKVHIMDNRIIEGTIIDQIEETLEFIQKHINVEFRITGKPQRDEIWDYPLPALREAITNAICHRDYSDTADIQIKVFDDSLQIWSPGFLPFNMTVEDLLDPAHSSKPRNHLIAQVFYDMALKGVSQ